MLKWFYKYLDKIRNMLKYYIYLGDIYYNEFNVVKTFL